MVGMLRTRRPTRVYEHVVKRLLYVVDHTPLEVGRIISEHSNPRDRLLND
jgi:hypothetical protein